jgi:hypothetical protein
VKAHLAALLTGIATHAAAPEIAVAQTSATEAIALAKTYIDTHNSHDLDAVMKLYHPDATFQLSMGRALVKGEAAIRELERFDAVAGSLLVPQQWSARPDGKGWLVSVDAVIENSRIFSALGLHIVIARPQAPVLRFENGLISQSTQPPIRAECLSIIMSGFQQTALWLQQSRSPLVPALLDAGRLRLEPATLPIIAEQLSLWRQSSGWAPPVSGLRACGTISPAP